MSDEFERRILLYQAGKPGHRTTEFWGKCVVQLGLTAGFLSGKLQTSELTVLLTVATLELTYMTWRSAIKTWTLAKSKRTDHE